MLDFGSKWTPAAFASPVLVETPGLTARPVAGLHLALVSGDTAAGLARLGLSALPLGATAVAADGPYALAMARDRCLAVSTRPFDIGEGWHAEGFAMTEVTDGLAAVDLQGADLRRILMQATTLDWAQPSRSAAISFAGTAAAASFHGDGAVLRLFVEAPSVAFLRDWLRAACAS